MALPGAVTTALGKALGQNIQLSHTQTPGPQKLEDNKYYNLKPLYFGTFCYTAIDS